MKNQGSMHGIIGEMFFFPLVHFLPHFPHFLLFIIKKKESHGLFLCLILLILAFPRPEHLKPRVSTDGEGRRNSARLCATAVRRLGKQHSNHSPLGRTSGTGPKTLPKCCGSKQALTGLVLQPRGL